MSDLMLGLDPLLLPTVSGAVDASFEILNSAWIFNSFLHRIMWEFVVVFYCILTWTCCLTACGVLRLVSMLDSFGLRRYPSFNPYRSTSQYTSSVDAVGFAASTSLYFNRSFTCQLSLPSTRSMRSVSCWWGFLLRDALLLPAIYYYLFFFQYNAPSNDVASSFFSCLLLLLLRSFQWLVLVAVDTLVLSSCVMLTHKKASRFL